MKTTTLLALVWCAVVSAGITTMAGDGPANGRIFWHTYLGQISNAPQTYMLDGRQYILQAAGTHCTRSPFTSRS
jgi:hypothetical protein